jgi:hypothetical protein
VVSAQTGPAGQCSASSLVPVAFPSAGFDAGYAGTIVSGNSYYRRSITVAAAVPAGEYQIDTVSYDGYTGRTGTAAQPYEQYVLEFLSASGDVLARTGPTADLADGVEEATWSGSVGSVVLAEDATQIRAIHRARVDSSFDPGPSANSVQPACVGVVPVQPPTTTTEPPTTTVTEPPSTTTEPPSTTTEPPSTTTEPPSTTTEPPSTTSEPPSTTTEPPTTTVIEPPTTTSSVPTTTAAPTTSSTVPTQVLPEVQENPDPTPVAATPHFTG